MLENSQVGKKLSGIFRGQIISHLPCGRCKIYIPDVYPEEWKNFVSSDLKDVYGQDLKGAKLPDAEQAGPLFGGSSSGNGMFSYPKIESFVWCMFEREDINRPVYFAAAIDITDMGGKNNFIECTVNSNNGKTLKHVIVCGNSKIIIDEVGAITLQTNGSTITMRKDLVTINASMVFMDVSENLKIDGNDGISLTGKNISMTSGFKIESKSPLYEISAPISCRINSHDFATE